MSKYIISGESLEQIANAIREKTGTTEHLTTAAMAAAISGIETGGGAVSETRIEYTKDESGNLIAATLYGFTEVPAYAFQRMSTLQTVDFTNSPEIFKINDFAFNGCAALDNVVLPETITEMGRAVFQDCTSLKNVTFPSAITKIPADTFSGCTSLQTFPFSIDKITEIGTSAFNRCSSLNFELLPKTIESIGTYAFRNCTGLKRVEIQCNLSPGTAIFCNCEPLKKVWIRSTCDTITAPSSDKAPFYGCSTSLDIYAEDRSKQSGWGASFNRAGPNGGNTITVDYEQTIRPW